MRRCGGARDQIYSALWESGQGILDLGQTRGASPAVLAGFPRCNPVPAGGVIFGAAIGLDASTIAAMQQRAFRRLLRSFERRGRWRSNDGFAEVRKDRVWPVGDRRPTDASVLEAAFQQVA